MIAGHPERTQGRAWCLVGVLLFVFGVVALSGPGRIDVVDGQTRFEVAKSLALHGDFAVRNPDVWFTVFPGRGGQRFSNYRFPHSVIGAGAILIADATGPDTEARRHFFFALTSAFAAALLAAVYFVWFELRGRTVRSAILWALAGVFCTPAYFYGTSTFDDIFAATAVTGALVGCYAARRSPSVRSALGCGLLFGLAFNVKQPLVAFALPGLALLDRSDDRCRTRCNRLFSFAAGIMVGVAAYLAFEAYKFPPETRALQAALLEKYILPFPGDIRWGLAVLTLSPSASMFLYSPTLVFSLSGVRSALAEDRRVGLATVLAGVAFFVFVAALRFCKGDPAWGPRYLTPLFASLWLFTPDGAARFGRREVMLVVACGFIVQVLALTVEVERLHISRGLPSTFGVLYPRLYFEPANADLLGRPQQILEVWRSTPDPGQQFTWSTPATAGPALASYDVLGPDPIERFKVLNAFRPWWASMKYMPEGERPVNTHTACLTLVTIASLGLGTLWAGFSTRVARRRVAQTERPGGAESSQD